MNYTKGKWFCFACHALFVTAIIALTLFSLGAANPQAQGGYSYGYDSSPDRSAELTTRSLATGDPITWLTEARDSHQWYVDHPGDQTQETGDTEHNRVWVNRYNLVIEGMNER